MNETELEERVRALEVDMWKGRDKENPSMTLRMQRVEDAQDRISGNLSKLVWLMVTVLGSVLGDVLFRHVR